MEPQKTATGDLLSQDCCIQIPKYQRRYTWGVENAHSLIRDIAAVATQPEPTPHWCGVIIYRESEGMHRCQKGRDNVNHKCREIIDGQQRLATIRIWIKALLDHAQWLGAPISCELGTFYFQQPNNDEFDDIVKGKGIWASDSQLIKVYCYFRYLLWLGQAALLSPEPIKEPRRNATDDVPIERWEAWVKKGRESAKETGIFQSQQLEVRLLLDMTVKQLTFLGLLIDDEEPEQVFAALNGNRTELGQFDHLRNFCFSKIHVSRRDKVFQDFWGPAESEFDVLQVKRGVGREQLKATFLYDYLISIGEGAHGQFNSSRSFSTFRKLERSARLKEFFNVEEWVAERLVEGWVSERLGIEVALWKAQRELFETAALPGGGKLQLSRRSRRSLHRIRMVADGPPAPLVLWVLRRSVLASDDPKYFSPKDIEDVLRQLEGYLFKTLLSGRSLTNMRAGVIGSMASLDAQAIEQNGVAAVAGALRIIDSWTNVRWATLKRDLESSYHHNRPTGVYGELGSRGTLALLDAISEQLSNNADHGFLSNHWEHGEDPYWVEHIYPQQSKKWTNDLKLWRVASSDMDARVHDLGNLSALPSIANHAISNTTFAAKVAHISEVTEATTSPLQDWLNAEQWVPDNIDNRSHELMKVLMVRWPDPIDPNSDVSA